MEAWQQQAPVGADQMDDDPNDPMSQPVSDNDISMSTTLNDMDVSVSDIVTHLDIASDMSLAMNPILSQEEIGSGPWDNHDSSSTQGEVIDDSDDHALEDYLDPTLVEAAFAEIEGTSARQDTGQKAATARTCTKNVGNICLDTITNGFKPAAMMMGPLYPLLECALSHNFAGQSNAFRDRSTFMTNNWKSIAREVCSTFEAMAKLWTYLNKIGGLVMQYYVNQCMTKGSHASQEASQTQ